MRNHLLCAGLILAGALLLGSGLRADDAKKAEPSVDDYAKMSLPGPEHKKLDPLAGHSSLGSALTMRGVQAARPSLYALTEELARVSIPVLVLVGDEDEGCLEPALMLKRTIPTAGLTVRYGPATAPRTLRRMD